MTDLTPCLTRFDDVEPVAAGALARIGGDDLDDLAVARHAVDGHDHTVDLGTHHLVAHRRVNGVGKVDHRRALGQCDDIALWGENKDLILENIGFKRLHELIVIARLVLVFQKLRHPCKALIHFLLAVCARLIFPMGGDTVFGDMVHFLGADLHLKRNAVATDHGGVQRAIEIWLWR